MKRVPRMDHVDAALRIVQALRGAGNVQFQVRHGTDGNRDTLTVEHPDKRLRNLVHALALKAADPFAIDLRHYAGRWVITVIDGRADYLEALALKRHGREGFIDADGQMHRSPDAPVPLGGNDILDEVA